MFRSAAISDDWDAARELLSEYLRLPDAWPHHQPSPVLPAAMTHYLETFPPSACLPPAGTVLLSFPGARRPNALLVLTGLDQFHAQLSRLYVRPAVRRTGIGRGLVIEAIRLATAAQCQALRLDVLPARRAAIDLYRSLGFQQTAAPGQNPHGLVFMIRDV